MTWDKILATLDQDYYGQDDTSDLDFAEARIATITIVLREMIGKLRDRDDRFRLFDGEVGVLAARANAKFDEFALKMSKEIETAANAVDEEKEHDRRS